MQCTPLAPARVAYTGIVLLLRDADLVWRGMLDELGALYIFKVRGPFNVATA